MENRLAVDKSKVRRADMAAVSVRLAVVSETVAEVAQGLDSRRIDKHQVGPVVVGTPPVSSGRFLQLVWLAVVFHI